MNTEPEASPRTPTGETPLSTTPEPEVRWWRQGVAVQAFPESAAPYLPGMGWTEVTVTPVVAQGAATPAGATWHTDPPPGWSTFGAHAFMDEVPALEFWGEEYGGDGLPIWERPVPAPDADQLSGIRNDGTNNEEGKNR